MALQANACILEQRRLGAGRALLCSNTNNGEKVWAYVLKNKLASFPFRAFNNITDFHDFIKYGHQTITMRKA